MHASPLRPTFTKRPVQHHPVVLTFGSLAIGDGTATDTNGFLAITSALLGQPTDGFRATGSRVVVAGSGSKALGVIDGSAKSGSRALNLQHNTDLSVGDLT
jgi:hypothetical protein